MESRARGIFGQGEFQVVVEAVRFVLGQEVEIELQSPEIEFSNAVVRKRLTEPVTEVIFIGKPRESCVPGHKHPVLLLVRDTEKGCELKSISFDVKVVDYAIDHVSRPRLQQVSAGLSGLGAVALFILTLLQQVETSFGLTSGTAAAVLAAGIYTRFAYMFRQPGSTATTR